jgi:hypothetical protein
MNDEILAGFRESLERTAENIEDQDDESWDPDDETTHQPYLAGKAAGIRFALTRLDQSGLR